MLTRVFRFMGAALLLAVIPAFYPGSSLNAAGCGTDLKLLVVAADGTEPSLAAIRKTLDYIGTPYEVVVAAQAPTITADKLASGCHAFYQGIIQTSADLVYADPTLGYVSALQPGEQATLDAFAAQTGARELVWYSGWTGPSWGINWPSGAVSTTAAAPLQAAFTAAGSAIFPHVNTASPLTIANAYVFLTTAADANSKPLLVDSAGHALAVNARFPDGRDVLMLMFDSNPYLTHAQVLGYDLVNWVTRGLFLGERHAYMSPQIDDLFISNQMWTPDTACGTPVDSTTTEFRLSGKDYRAALAWQRNLRMRSPLTSDVRLTWAFNAWGAYSDDYTPDTLTSVVRNNAAEFYFVSHTWDHQNLDAATAEETWTEILLNDFGGWGLGLRADPRALVTPDVSGLKNPAAMTTAYALGVRYLVTDTSQPGYMNPTPNTGIYNQYAPGILMIPRYPTNLYFNVSTPAEWTAEYNCMYRSYWGRDFSYSDVLNNISDTWVSYLLNGDLNPLMFHQPNLRAYDGMHSLLSDLIEMTVAKYARLVRFPILSPSMTAVGQRMASRQRYNESGVAATFVPGVGVVLTAQRPATIPITGLRTTGSESYAGSWIAHIAIGAGQTTTVPLF